MALTVSRHSVSTFMLDVQIGGHALGARESVFKAWSLSLRGLYSSCGKGHSQKKRMIATEAQTRSQMSSGKGR